MPKTTWKWKNLAPGGRFPGAPLASANSCMDVTDIVQTVPLPFPARAHSYGGIFVFTTAIYFITWNGLCGGLYKCSDRVFANSQKWQYWHQRLYYVKKIQWQNVTPPPPRRGNRIWASHNHWFQVKHYPFHTNLTFACKTETLGSLYSHALLILLESSKSKHQVVHEQKFKNLLSSTCQVSVERIVLDLESEVLRGPGSIPTGG